MYHTCIMLHMYHATSAGRKAGRLSTNTAQSIDRLSTNKAYQTKKGQQKRTRKVPKPSKVKLKNCRGAKKQTKNSNKTTTK